MARCAIRDVAIVRPARLVNRADDGRCVAVLSHGADRSHDAIAARAKTSDVAWLRRIVAQRIAQQIDSLGHGLGRNDDVGPDQCRQLVV